MGLCLTSSSTPTSSSTTYAGLETGGHRLHYSVITRAELFAGDSATDLATELLSPFREIAVDRPLAGRIRRETGIRLPDALIAATAIEHRLALATAIERTSTPSADSAIATCKADPPTRRCSRTIVPDGMSASRGVRRPGAEETADEDELADVVRRVVGGQQRLAEEGSALRPAP